MEDSKKLHQILAAVITLRCPHQHLEDAARELEKDLEKQLSEKQLNDGQLSVLEFTVGGNSTGSEGGQHMSIQFVNPERRSIWEQAFREAKQKFGAFSFRRSLKASEFIGDILFFFSLVCSIEFRNDPNARVHLINSHSQDPSWSTIYVRCFNAGGSE